MAYAGRCSPCPPAPAKFSCSPCWCSSAAEVEGQTVTAAIAARERQEQEQQDAIQGTLRSIPVDLFTQRALRWVQTRGGAWVMSLGAQHGTLRLQPDGADTWQVVQVRREIQPVLLGHGLPLPYVALYQQSNYGVEEYRNRKPV